MVIIMTEMMTAAGADHRRARFCQLRAERIGLVLAIEALHQLRGHLADFRRTGSAAVLGGMPNQLITRISKSAALSNPSSETSLTLRRAASGRRL